MATTLDRPSVADAILPFVLRTEAIGSAMVTKSRLGASLKGEVHAPRAVRKGGAAYEAATNSLVRSVLEPDPCTGDHGTYMGSCRARPPCPGIVPN